MQYKENMSYIEDKQEIYEVLCKYCRGLENWGRFK